MQATEVSRLRGFGQLALEVRGWLFDLIEHTSSTTGENRGAIALFDHTQMPVKITQEPSDDKHTFDFWLT